MRRSDDRPYRDSLLALGLLAVFVVALGAAALSGYTIYEIRHADDDDDNASPSTVYVNTETLVYSTPIPGPPGATGPQGYPGAPVMGPQGANGTNGTNGTNGVDGAQGVQGEHGVSCWDLNGNGACDTGTEDTNNDGICDLHDCEFASQWNGLYNGTCPCVCSLNSTECHGQTLISPMTGELFTCSAASGRYLASEYSIMGEQYLSCPNGQDLTTNRGCAITFGLASTVNTGLDMALPFFHKATFTRVGVSMGLPVAGPYDVQLWGNNNATSDNVAGMSLLCTLASGVTEQAFLANVTDCHIEGNQFLALGIENASGGNIMQFLMVARYRDEYPYCSALS